MICYNKLLETMHKLSKVRPRYEVSYATLCAYYYIHVYIYLSLYVYIYIYMFTARQH